MRNSYIWWMIYREIISALSILNLFTIYRKRLWFIWMDLIELNLISRKTTTSTTTTINKKIETERHSNQNDDFWKRFYLTLFFYSFVHFGVHLLVYTHAYKRRSLIYTWTAYRRAVIEWVVCVRWFTCVVVRGKERTLCGCVYVRECICARRYTCVCCCCCCILGRRDR